MTQKGPELKSPILGRLTSTLRLTRGNRPRGVHFWPLIFSRITFTIHIGCIRDVLWVYFASIQLPNLGIQKAFFFCRQIREIKLVTTLTAFYGILTNFSRFFFITTK